MAAAVSPTTIGRYGPARGGVRVYEDERRQLVTVFWRAHGRRRKQSYPLTREGRKEARTFAKALVKEQATLKTGGRAPITTRTLRKLYFENQLHLRERTRALYEERFSKWELYVGADSLAEQADGLTMAGFVSALRQIGHAVNQIALMVNQVKLVYAWARSVKAIAQNDVAAYLFKRGKDEARGELGEHRATDVDILLAELDPQSSRTWRPHAVTQFVASQGVRINAVLNLRWSDVDLANRRARWRRATDKTGREWWQPLRDGAWGALQTAQYWRARDRYAGDYVFYSSHRTAGRDRHYQVQAWWQAFRNAEDRAELPHKDLVAAHGFRRMVVNDLWKEFGGDLKLVMEFTGHHDLRSFQKYLRKRDDRLLAAVAALDERERERSPAIERPKPAPKRHPAETVAVSPYAVRATGRIRTDDREHSKAKARRTKPVVVAKSPSKADRSAPRRSGSRAPKPAPKRHPTGRGGRR